MTDRRLHIWRTGYCATCTMDVIFKDSDSHAAPRCPGCFEFIAITSPAGVRYTLGEAERTLGVRKTA